MCRLCPRPVRHRSTLLVVTVFWGVYAFSVYTYLRSEEKTVQQKLKQLHKQQDYQQKPDLQGQQQQQKEQQQQQDQQQQQQQQQAEKEHVQQGGQLAGRQEQRVADQAEEDDVVYPTYVERGPADGPGNSCHDEAR